MVIWHDFESREQLDQTLAAAIAARLRGDLSMRSKAMVAMSGGSTPQGMFQQLSQQTLDWSSVNVTLVDERFVPPDHDDSNQKLLQENLLINEAAAAKLLPMYEAGYSAEAAAQAYADALLGRLPGSVLVLGMGGDGHTASWFPDSPQRQAVTDAASQALAAAVDTPSSPHRRLTMTLPAVQRFDSLILHITGADKRSVLLRNLRGETDEPIAAICRREDTRVDVYWAP